MNKDKNIETKSCTNLIFLNKNNFQDHQVGLCPWKLTLRTENVLTIFECPLLGSLHMNQKILWGCLFRHKVYGILLSVSAILIHANTYCPLEPSKCV